jgi:hypothetical protein
MREKKERQCGGWGCKNADSGGYDEDWGGEEAED